MGLEAGVWTTYAGKMARDAYTEVTFDSCGGFCKVFYEKLGMLSRDMILSAFAGRVEPGSTATHDGASTRAYPNCPIYLAPLSKARIISATTVPNVVRPGFSRTDFESANRFACVTLSLFG